jgi:hypothetical protein
MEAHSISQIHPSGSVSCHCHTWLARLYQQISATLGHRRVVTEPTKNRYRTAKRLCTSVYYVPKSKVVCSGILII